MGDHDAAYATNLALWNERASVHAGSGTYDLDGLATDHDRLSGVVDFDRRYLGDLAGLRVVHLQCHIGTDTLSLARLGAAEVTGYDFSARSLEVARDLAAKAGVDITYVEGELYDAPRMLPNGHFDVVYTGVGALCWLPDITRWAKVVASLLTPGGRLVVRDSHPVLDALDYDREDEQLRIRYPYFETPDALVFDEPGSYTDNTDAHVWQNTVCQVWNHSIGEILTAVLDAGLEIRRFEELRDVAWQPWSLWARDESTGRYRLPEHLRDLVPAMFALVAQRPAEG